MKIKSYLKAGKILKFLNLSMLLFGMGYYIAENYIKWNVHPEVTINTESISSRNIPFPAVTICPPLIVPTKFLNMSKFYSSSRSNARVKGQDLSLVTASVQVCHDSLGLLISPELNFDNFDQNTVKILNLTSPQLHETFYQCELFPCEDCTKLFIRTLTDDGYCFTFNMLGYHSIFNGNLSADFDSYKRKGIPKSYNVGNGIFHDDEKDPEPSNWTLDNGYKNTNDFSQPQRAMKTELKVITIIENKEIPNFCEARRNGYKIILHPPNEIPTVLHPVNYVQLKNYKKFSITADIKSVDESLQQFHPEERQCYFEHERNLRFFKSYSQVKCEYECMINFTMQECECVKFSMPRTNDMKICDDSKIRCLLIIFKDWPENFSKKLNGNVDEKSKFPCNCMPTCNQINYRIVGERMFEINEQNSRILNLYLKLENKNG